MDVSHSKQVGLTSLCHDLSLTTSLLSSTCVPRVYPESFQWGDFSVCDVRKCIFYKIICVIFRFCVDEYELFLFLQKICLLTIAFNGVTSSSHAYIRSVVSEDWLSGGAITTQTNSFANFQQATAKCSYLGWCACVCQTPDLQYVLTNLLVTGGVTDPASGNKMVCYTRRRRGYNILTATASPIFQIGSARVLENIVDGIYDFTLAKCYHGKDVPGGQLYYRADLGGVRKINKVVYLSQSAGNMSNKLHDIQILTGNTTTNNNDDYVLIGTQPESPQNYSQEIVVEGTKPHWGRYVLLLKTSGKKLLFCHLEIY